MIGSWRSGIAAATVLLTLVVGGCSGDEQGGLEGASPGPGAVVGGDIDQVELFYDDLIVAADGSIVGPDGDELAVDTEVDTDIRALILLEQPLTAPGEYTVRHVVETVDGDRVEETYAFTFDPQAPPPQLVFASAEEGAPWVVWTVGVLGAVVLIVLTVRLLVAIRRLAR